MRSEYLACGTAIRDITPTRENGVLPMPAGFSASTHPFTEVHDRTHLRFLALGDGETTVLIVSADVINLNARIFGCSLSRHTGLPEDAIFLIETGAHATIRAGSEARNSSDPEGLRRMKIYENIVMSALLSGAEEALGNMEPVMVSLGSADCYLNTYRYAMTDITVGKETFPNYTIRANFAGPSDKSLCVIRFDHPDGAPKAFFFSYPMFSVMMDDNIMGEDDTSAISADIGGYVSGHIENRYPGSVALWCPGAGCDQNPILMAKMFCPDPDGTGKKIIYLKKDACEFVYEYMGSMGYEAAIRAVESASEKERRNYVRYWRESMEIPGRSVLVRHDEESGFEHYISVEGDNFPLTLTVLRIGEIAIAFHGGNLFSTLGKHMRAHSLSPHTFVATGYVSNNVRFFGGLCDDEALELGGHDGRSKKYQPGFIKSALVLLLNRAILQTNEKPYQHETVLALNDAAPV